MSDGDRNIPASARGVLVPQVPVLVAGFREVLWLSPEGEIEALSPAEARGRVEIEPPMLCHAKATARRLDSPGFRGARSARTVRVRLPGAVLRADAARPRRGARTTAAASPGRSCVTLATAARALLRSTRTGDRCRVSRRGRGDGSRRVAVGAGGAGSSTASRTRCKAARIGAARVDEAPRVGGDPAGPGAR